MLGELDVHALECFTLRGSAIVVKQKLRARMPSKKFDAGRITRHTRSRRGGGATHFTTALRITEDWVATMGQLISPRSRCRRRQSRWANLTESSRWWPAVCDAMRGPRGIATALMFRTVSAEWCLRKVSICGTSHAGGDWRPSGRGAPATAFLIFRRVLS